jgi:aerobic-type carbon monoxide dehydrogenase small subunit (CoxS/CutS family)
VTAPAETVRVNGDPVDLARVPPGERLLDTLRWRLGLKGTKEGCRAGSCGACTVLVNGRTILSCLALTHELSGTEVATVESVGNRRVGALVQQAFVEEGALQCGYCTPGFVVALTGLLEEHGPSAKTDVLLEELGTNLCRCTGYRAIARAVERVRRELA